MKRTYNAAIPNRKGQYRVYGYGNRVWIATLMTPAPLNATSKLKLRDYKGNTVEVFADEVLYDHILNT